jgi:hypothetical protein
MEDLEFVHIFLAMKDHCWARWTFYLGLCQFFLYSFISFVVLDVVGHKLIFCYFCVGNIHYFNNKRQGKKQNLHGQHRRCVIGE